MSTSVGRRENATELRLTYEELVAGRLIIVIEGVPAIDESPRAAELRLVSAAEGATGVDGPPSSPLAAEAEVIGEAVGYSSALFKPLVIAAWRGQEAAASELIASMIEDAPTAQAQRAIAVAEYARAVLFNGLGRYRDAFAAADRACAHECLGSLAPPLLELVEAAARSNARAAAAKALGLLEEHTCCGTEWALGVRARSAALLNEGDQAERFYCDAIARLTEARSTAQLARAQLVYGEWLRRENRRLEARTHLRAARETFSCVGAAAFAERALRELRATGETARRRTDETRADLTPQEGEIARLARDGYSNPEIGAQLFISPRTVQFHLRKVFQKLEISSRNQLARIPPIQLGAPE